LGRSIKDWGLRIFFNKICKDGDRFWNEIKMDFEKYVDVF